MSEIDFCTLSKNVKYIHKIKSRNANYSDIPNILHDDIKSYLVKNNIKSLYCHQTEMFEKVLNGKNVVISTSTASGKSLAFLLPVINRILQNPSSRAIFIYPTKALTRDQYLSILPIIEHLGSHRIDAGVYDGDTPVDEKKRIRKEANIILTNPEMLNLTFLPNHNKFGFDFLLKNLEFIVIDELHYYRGAIGSHLANIFRRLKRITKFYKSSPQFLCSSATIANPIELAENICGGPFDIIDNDCSPSGEKDILFYQPQISNVDLNIVVTNIIAKLLSQEVKLLAFTKSRRDVEIILKEVRDQVNPVDCLKTVNKSLLNTVSAYRGGLRAEERRHIESQMKKGLLKVIISTNALELGIDIGDLNIVMCIGFPKTKASFFQQIGRAGRKCNKSYAILLLDNFEYYDQFILNNPEWIFNTNVEHAIVDKDNLYIQIAHIRASALELPLSLDDIQYFPDLGEILPVLIMNNEVIKRSNRYYWYGNEYPAGDFSLRAISDIRYKVINKINNETITEMDNITAFNTIYKDAIYIHDGEMYYVEELNENRKTAFVLPVDYDYYTIPIVFKNLTILSEFETEKLLNTNKYFGDVSVSKNVVGFKQIKFHSKCPIGNTNLEIPLSSVLETKALWIRIPNKVKLFFEQKYCQDNSATIALRHKWNNLEKFEGLYFFESIGYVIKNSFMISTMTSDNDIDYVLFNCIDENQIECNNIAIYDQFMGGLGYAEKGYSLINDILLNAVDIVNCCKCIDGCPVCIGSNSIKKSHVLWALKSFLKDETEPEIFIKEEDKKQIHLNNNLFDIKEINKHWDVFKERLSNEYPGIYMSEFLKTISNAKCLNKTILLETDKQLNTELLISESELSTIDQILSMYFLIPNHYKIKVKCKDDDVKKKDSIKRGFNRLKEGN